MRIVTILFLAGLVVSVARAADWPMLGMNAQRTGWTSEAVSGPPIRKWYRSFHGEGLADGVQAVVADGRVFIGTMHGTLHAIDAETGKDQWSRKLGGAILHSAAVGEGVVYVCCGDGKLYALDAATGDEAWTFATGEALWNAPLLAEGKIYFGGRDGFVYAVNPDGTQAWKTPVGGPVLQSCAYGGGKVFVAAENMTAYAFDAATGDVLWTGQLYGVTARAYHPVVAGDVVMFTTAPGLGKYGPLDVLLEAGREIGLQPRQRVGADPRGPEEPREVYRKKDQHDQPLLAKQETLDAQLAGVRRVFKAQPKRRSFFAFNVETGEEPWIAPIVWQESCGGTGDPPIVSPDGKTVMVKYALMTWARRGDYAPYLRAGLLDLATGDVRSIMDNFEHSKSPMWGMTHDEMARFTGAGGQVIHAREGFPGFRGIVGLDLQTKQRTVLGDNIHFGNRSIGPMNLIRLETGGVIPPTQEYLPRGTGVFGGTGTYAAVSIADGTIYYIPGHEGRTGCMLIAWTKDPAGKGTAWIDHADDSLYDPAFKEPENIKLIQAQPLDWDMLRPPYGRCWPRDVSIIPPEPDEQFKARQADARTYAWALSDEVIDAYVDAPARANSRASQAVREQLAAKVEELLSTTWQPMRFPDLMFGGWTYFDDPTEQFIVLAAAYPHLDADLQGRVKEHLRKLFASHNPLEGRYLDPQAGQRRTLYDLPADANVRSWKMRSDPIERLWAMWAWADACEEWETLKPLWQDRIRGLIYKVKQPKSAEELLRQNGKLSGVIAYVRLAREFGDDTAAADGLKVARMLLKGRVEAERTYTLTHFMTRRPEMAVPIRYWNLTPSLAALVGDHAGEQADALYQRYIAHHRPVWYIAWPPLMYEYWERSIDHPTQAWATFAARAMLFGDNAETLAGYLDIPWCKADLYYIHKLAMIADAAGKLPPGWTFSSSAPRHVSP